MTTESTSVSRPVKVPSALAAWGLARAIFAAVQFASLFTPPLLDDADASHAEAAQHMAETGDFVTLKINGIRYLEKPPLPYWIDAGLYHVFGQNVFATHLQNALAHSRVRLAGLALGRARMGPPCRSLCGPRHSHFHWAVSLYPLLHPRGPAELSVSACALLLSHWHGVAPPRPLLCHVGRLGACHADQRPYRASLLCRRGHSPAAAQRTMAALASVQTAYGIAAVSGHRCALAHPGRPCQSRSGPPIGNHPTPDNVHGFWYFYFVNEHFLRFLGERFPHDYNKMPFVWYWLATSSGSFLGAFSFPQCWLSGLAYPP